MQRCISAEFLTVVKASCNAAFRRNFWQWSKHHATLHLGGISESGRNNKQRSSCNAAFRLNFWQWSKHHATLHLGGISDSGRNIKQRSSYNAAFRWNSWQWSKHHATLYMTFPISGISAGLTLISASAVPHLGILLRIPYCFVAMDSKPFTCCPLDANLFHQKCARVYSPFFTKWPMFDSQSFSIV